MPKIMSIHDAFMCVSKSLEKNREVLFTGEVNRTSNSFD
jgi:hypothetical protein